MLSYEYLLSNIDTIKGGIQNCQIIKKKNIYTIFDLHGILPRDFVDRTDNAKKFYMNSK